MKSSVLLLLCEGDKTLRICMSVCSQGQRRGQCYFIGFVWRGSECHLRKPANTQRTHNLMATAASWHTRHAAVLVVRRLKLLRHHLNINQWPEKPHRGSTAIRAENSPMFSHLVDSCSYCYFLHYSYFMFCLLLFF